MKRFLLVSVIAILSVFALAAQSTGETFYVSRTGDNSDGKTFATAWNELSRIDWSVVSSGDTILVDGGTAACPKWGDEAPGCGSVYNTALSFGKDGVTVRGVGGTVILDGNQTVFTYCAENVGMASPVRSSAPGASVLETAVSFNGRSNASLENFHIRNAKTYGINFGGGDNNRVSNVRVHHINNPADTTNNSVGITSGYTADNLLVENSEIWRNGQDAIRVTADNFTLKDSYIHDHYCNHPDGIQSFVPTSNDGVGTGEQVITNLVVTGNVFERVGLQSIFLGENANHQSWVNGALIQNNLFLSSFYGLKTKHSRSTNIVFDHNTVITSREFAIEWCCGGATAPMTISNNIFYQTRNPSGTGFYLPTVGGNTAFTGNCVFQSGRRSGNFSESGTVTLDPLFTSLSTGNYALRAGSPCAGRGASITSRASLLSVVTSTPEPTFTVTPTETSTETSTPTSTATETPTNTPTVTATPTEYALDCRITFRQGIPIGIECP